MDLKESFELKIIIDLKRNSKKESIKASGLRTRAFSS